MRCFWVFFGTFFVFIMAPFASYQALLDTLLADGYPLSVPKTVSPDLTIDLKTCFFELEHQRLTGSGGVTIRYDGLQLFSDTLRIELPYDLRVSENVRFFFKQVTGTTQTAHYALDKNEVTLKGDAVLNDGTDYFKGEKMVFNTQTESIKSYGRSRIKISTQRVAQ